MINKATTLLVGIITLLSGCTSKNPEINVVCVRDNVGNYKVKWETYPKIEGEMKLYVSETPEGYNYNEPISVTNISEEITTYITKDNTTRKYFKLSFNNKYFVEVSSREILGDSIQNLRDMGGYLNWDKRPIRWGKVYRASSLTELSDDDVRRLNDLQIKTIIDLRSKKEAEGKPVKYKSAQVIHIPIEVGEMCGVMQKIRDGRIRKGDGYLLMQDMYLQSIEKEAHKFAEALDILTREENYPILFTCTYGKDSTGLLAMLLLSALDVPEETIMRDYLATNEYLNLRRFNHLAKGLDAEAQETMALLLTANENFIDAAMRKIKKDYDSVDNYLLEKLGLTDDKQECLKEILLY